MKPDIHINGITLDGESYCEIARADEVFHPPEEIRYLLDRTGEILQTLLLRRESMAQSQLREWCACQTRQLKTGLHRELQQRNLPLIGTKKGLHALIRQKQRRINIFIQPPFLSSPIPGKETERWQKPTGTTAVAIHVDKCHAFQKLRRWGHEDEPLANRTVLNLFGAQIEANIRDRLPEIMPLLSRGDPSYAALIADAIEDAFYVVSDLQNIPPEWYAPIVDEQQLAETQYRRDHSPSANASSIVGTASAR